MNSCNNHQDPPQENLQTQCQVKCISKALYSPLEADEIFQGFLNQPDSGNMILLESSEIQSRQNLHSIMMLQAAIRIEANGQRVKLQAVTANGVNALQHITALFIANNKQLVKNHDSQSLQLEYPRQQGFIDEDSRLKLTSPIDSLRLILKSLKTNSNDKYAVFLCGLFAYDLIASYESLPQVEQGNSCPDLVFYLAESLIVIDHKSGHKRLYCNHFSGENERNTYFELARSMETVESLLSSFHPCQTQQVSAQVVNDEASVDLSDQEYQSLVKQLKNNIRQGDIFQVVPSRTYSLECRSTMQSYRALKLANPSPYMFYMQDQNFCLFGASPESALKYTKSSNQVELYPIAGTRPRGRKSPPILTTEANVSAEQNIDLDLDARIEAELKLDAKEVAEHMMLVDLARNDIARIADAGTTHVPKLLEVDRYSQVMHLVSCVRGQLRQELDALHAYQACMNMGTLTGAPKIRATELIRQVEGKRRGSYGGAVGYLNGAGDMDTCIVIRSAFCQNGIAYVQAGAGVVFDSDPEMEALETENKAKAVVRAVALANQQLDNQTTSISNREKE